MGTWYNDAPQEFHAWVHSKFAPHSVPLTIEALADLRNAWEQGNKQGKEHNNVRGNDGNTL